MDRLPRDVVGSFRSCVRKDVELNLSGLSFGKANVFPKFDKADSRVVPGSTRIEPGSLRGKSEGVMETSLEFVNGLLRCFAR